MTTLTPYQQAVLTELGIVQWHLRDTQAPAQVATPMQEPAPIQNSAAVTQPAPRANAESAIARLKQAVQGSVPAVQTPSEPAPTQAQPPVLAPNVESAPKAEPTWVSDKEPIFSDVLRALNWPEGQRTLSWQVADTLKLDGDILYCPTPAALVADSRLKRHLWQLLQAC